MFLDRHAGAATSSSSWPLGWRLPLSICGIIVAALGIFLWVAYQRVDATLLAAGADRARGAAAQVANIFEVSSVQGRDEARRLAASDDVRLWFEAPDPESAATVRQRLIGTGTTARRVELWTTDGTRILEASRPATGVIVPAQSELPAAIWPITPGTSALTMGNGLIYADYVEEVVSSDRSQRIGLLLIRGHLTVNPPGILARLLGNDAHVLVGTVDGGQWTDLTRAVDAPPLQRLHDGVADWAVPGTGHRLGALVRIRDTPWGAWVDFPRAAMVAPAAAFLRDMLLVALLVVVAAAILVRAVTRRLTTPLANLTTAAESMAAGTYGERVSATGGRELGRLADAFNAMAEHVDTSHQSMQSRIAERTTALEALGASEARYRAIVNVALDCIVTIDTRGMVTEFNPAAERVFGYRRAQAVGRELAELIIPPQQRTAHRRGMAHFLATGEGPVLGRQIELTGMRADGTEFPVEIAITTIEAAGQERLFTGVMRDITQRKRAEAALIESERAFRSTFDEAPLGIAQVSVDGRWLRANRRATAIFGYDAEEMLGTLFSEVFLTGEEQPDPQLWPTVVATAAADVPQERLARRKSGEELWISLTVSAHTDDLGSPLYYIVIMEDTSERRRLEERLRQSQKMEAIGQLAGGIAHDFNNLLTAILGYAHLLSDEFTGDDPRLRDVEEIVRAAERSAALTRQLLAFSRKQVLQPRILNVNTQVVETTDMLRRVIGEHIELVTTLAPDLESVCVDPTQLEQIVMNLAVNARDAMPNGGRLTVETANVELGDIPRMRPVSVAPGRYVMLAVSDTGIGMDEETQRRLFEPFFTTKAQGRGTGLGLATVYGIVKQSDGYIWVYSEPGNGATFKVYLPAVEIAAVLADEVRGHLKPTSGDETILLVEDERAVRILARVMLERVGYRVLDAAGPDEALEIFTAQGDYVDLLISDVVMPGCHGPALYQRLCGLRPGLRVLFMSGYTDEEIVHAGRIDTGVAFIEKPFTASRLTLKVREVLDRPA